MIFLASNARVFLFDAVIAVREIRKGILRIPQNILMAELVSNVKRIFNLHRLLTNAA